MSSTVAPVAKQALLDALQASPDLAGVQVGWGHPGSELNVDQTVFVDSVKQKSDWQGLGRRLPASDNFTIEVVVLVHRGGNDQKTAELRAWELRGFCAAAVRGDVRLGDTVDWARMEDGDQTNFHTRHGWLTQIVSLVACTARIRD